MGEQEKSANDSKQTVWVSPVTFLTVEPATFEQQGQSVPFAVMSLETKPGIIDQLAFSHADASRIMMGLMEILATHHNDVATFLLECLSDATDDSNEDDFDPESEEETYFVTDTYDSGGRPHEEYQRVEEGNGAQGETECDDGGTGSNINSLLHDDQDEHGPDA